MSVNIYQSDFHKLNNMQLTWYLRQFAFFLSDTQGKRTKKANCANTLAVMCYCEVPKNKLFGFSYNSFLELGYIETPIFKRKITSLHIEGHSPAKVLNYFLQGYESEVGNEIIGDCRAYLAARKGIRVNLVMYQYDAFLFDNHRSEGNEVIEELKTIISKNNFYPVKIKVGSNFKDLTEIEV
jgi:hypothetical protein